jgi:hypothetical protein
MATNDDLIGLRLEDAGAAAVMPSHLRSAADSASTLPFAPSRSGSGAGTVDAGRHGLMRASRWSKALTHSHESPRRSRRCGERSPRDALCRRAAASRSWRVVCRGGSGDAIESDARDV